MIVEIRLLADEGDRWPRKVVINDEAISRAVGQRVWTVGELVDLALATAPANLTELTTTRPERSPFEVIEGGKSQRQRG
jgi:hypothetical protein